MLEQRGKRNGIHVITAQSVEALTARHRTGMFDNTFKQVYDWGLGFLKEAQGGKEREPFPYHYGAHASPRAFGHGGQQSSIGFCDPEYGLVVAWVLNGMPGEPEHARRNHSINTAIYEDLELAE